MWGEFLMHVLRFLVVSSIFGVDESVISESIDTYIFCAETYLFPLELNVILNSLPTKS